MAKNKILPLVAGVAAIAVFGAGWAILKNTASDEAAVESVTVDTLDGNITQIDYNVQDDEVSLVYTDGEWQWSEDADFPLRQTYPETMVSLGQAPSATALVTETPENLADYGLETPSSTITLTNDAGESKTYLLGDANTHTGAYYLREDGSNTVYTMSSEFYSAFSNPLYGMIITETWPIVSASAVNEVTLSQGGKTFLNVDVTRTEVEVASSSESDASSVETTTETVTTYKASDGSGFVDANETATASWISSLATMSFASCMDYKASDDTLTSLGLNGDATYTLTVKYTSGEEEKTFTLLIGNGSGDGVYYVKQADSTAVNTIEGDTLTTFLGTTFSSLTA
jgi:hypothetical protein